jgi:hypothetical protein
MQIRQYICVFTLIVILMVVVNNAHAQNTSSTVNEANQQKPTEEKQGGEYSGLENTGRQSQGVPNAGANPTPQAPISGLKVDPSNTTTNTAATAISQQKSPVGFAMLAGMGGAAAAAIGVGVWYFKKRNKNT